MLNCSTPITKMSHWLIGALELISDDYYRDLPIMEDITILPDIRQAARDSRVGNLDNIFLSTIFIVVCKDMKLI